MIRVACQCRPAAGRVYRMRLQVTLVCHAGTAAMRRAVFARDAPVDAAGMTEAARLAGVLPRPDRAWTSPALAAVQTARALGLKAVAAPALRDCDYGRWMGRRLADIGVEEPEALAAWLADPATAPHGGESGAELMARVAGWLEERRQAPGDTLAVTHPAVIRAAVMHVLGATPRSFPHLDVMPLTATVLTTHGGAWRLRSTGHGLQLT